MIDKITRFLKHEVWRIKIKELPRGKYLLLRPLRIFLLALRGFAEDRCQLRASALTFYSLLSVVPVMAMVFGIAKGFGFDNNLQELITQKLQGQEEVVQWIIKFANELLANTRGGVIAGVGVLILFWAVIKLLENIENAFNDIWGIKKGRTFARKLTDYLSIMLICPVLLITSSSLTVFITSQITLITEKIALLGAISTVIFFFLNLLPYCVLRLLFIFIYMVIPNIRVSYKGGLIAGIIAGTIFQVLQKGYIYFQIGVAKYNAIYGSFAALPLFLIWLQLSWLIVLFGAELSFAADNEEKYEFEPDCLNVSLRFKRILALRIVELCVKNFCKEEKPLDTLSLAHKLGAPVRLVREVLFNLVEANVLSLIKQNDELEQYYQPAHDIEKLTIKKVMDLLDKQGNETIPLIKGMELEKISTKLESMDRLIADSSENTALKNL
ncbi:MAG: YihY/virulence factor BrkB family protein [Proteobacteria bacterium]|nr:YihY/virulence factor BrkB family protein [Pseudomonadota bacterium]